MKLTIEMPWERNLSVNLYRFGKRSPKDWARKRRRKPEVQAWMERLSWEVKLAMYPRMEILDWPCDTNEWPALTILVDFRWPDKRHRDSHNYFKCICDAVASGLGIDDKDIRISTRSVTVDRENAGFTVEVSDESQQAPTS